MKKYIAIIIAALLALCACQQKWTSEIELAVSSTRQNINTPNATDFTLTVYSNQYWEVAVIQGGEWLAAKESSGNSLGYVHFSCSPNTIASARAAKVSIRAASGKEIIMNFVQDGLEEKAASVPDESL